MNRNVVVLYVWHNHLVTDINDANNNNVNTDIVYDLTPEWTLPWEWNLAWYPDVDQMIATKKKHGNRIYAITGRMPGDSTPYDPDPLTWYQNIFDEIIHFSSHWVRWRAPKHLISHFPGNTMHPVDAKKIYLFSSLNRNEHLHRSMMLDHLAKYSLIDSNIVSQLTDPNNFNSGYQFKWWTPEVITRDITLRKGDFFKSYIPEESQAVLRLVSPSSLTPFFTEKEVLPILHRKAFVIAGAWRGANHQFAEMFGFKLYDEIIDYSFDLLPTLEERCDHLANQLQVLQDAGNFDELYAQIERKIMWNLGHYISLLWSPDPTVPNLYIELSKLGKIKDIPITSGISLDMIMRLQGSVPCYNIYQNYVKGHYD